MQGVKTKERIAALRPPWVKAGSELADDVAKFQALLRELLEVGYAAGLNPQVSAGYRSFPEQAALFARGRTDRGPRVTNAAPGQSLHQYGIAADLFFLAEKNGKQVADYDLNKFRLLWECACKARLDLRGLFWSGLWTGTLRESCHFQLGRQDWRVLRAAYDRANANK